MPFEAAAILTSTGFRWSYVKGEDNMALQNAKDLIKQVTGISIGLAFLMILLGFFAIGLPLATGIGVALLVGWIITFSGFAHLAYAFAAQGPGAFLWRLLIGILYTAGGIYLVFHPTLGLGSLTLVLAMMLFLEGILQMIVFFQFRSLPGSGWILFDSVTTLLLGLMIGLSWPSSSLWAVGTLVGVNLIVSGFTRLVSSVAVRSELKTMAR